MHTLLSPYDIILDLAVAYHGPGVREVFAEYCALLDAAGAFDSLSPPGAERAAKVIGVTVCGDAEPVRKLRHLADAAPDGAFARAYTTAAEAW
jgi:hypothetical protein